MSTEDQVQLASEPSVSAVVLVQRVGDLGDRRQPSCTCRIYELNVAVGERVLAQVLGPVVRVRAHAPELGTVAPAQTARGA